MQNTYQGIRVVLQGVATLVPTWSSSWILHAPDGRGLLVRGVKQCFYSRPEHGQLVTVTGRLTFDTQDIPSLRAEKFAVTPGTSNIITPRDISDDPQDWEVYDHLALLPGGKTVADYKKRKVINL